MARIVVCGYMIRHPLAGNLLAYFQYLLGLDRLGHEVVYVEESGWPNACYDPDRRDYGDDPSAGLRIVRALLARYNTRIAVYYVNRETSSVEGADRSALRRMLLEADLLLNLGGVCWLPEFELCGRRALVDMDPLFTQLARFGAEGIDDYQAHFSYGANIGRAGCSIPDMGIDWRPTAPPVVLDLWAGDQPEPAASFTTVANWSSYGAISYQGQRYGQKDEEFLRLLDLPGRVSQTLELALAGVPHEIVQRLRAAGWSVRNAGDVSTDLQHYLSYVKGSKGEFSVAKHAYVKTRSGWFSDRSVCYLAAGRPVVIQDTGISDWVPTGRGVLTFTTVDDAVEALEQVAADYPAHRRSAREIAEEVFRYDLVLPRLLDAAFGAATARPLVVERGASQ